jgi:hypothetical protein
MSMQTKVHFTVLTNSTLNITHVDKFKVLLVLKSCFSTKTGSSIMFYMTSIFHLKMSCLQLYLTIIVSLQHLLLLES